MCRLLVASYLKQCCGIHPKAIRAWLPYQHQRLRIVYSEESIETNATKCSRLSLWLSFVL